jgi:hypothetical protein
MAIQGVVQKAVLEEVPVIRSQSLRAIVLNLDQISAEQSKQSSFSPRNIIEQAMSKLEHIRNLNLAEKPSK